MNIFEYFNLAFVRYALIAGVLVSVCAALVGAPLVLKRHSMIGDGLSHVAFGGMALASVINLTNDLILIMPLTVVTAVLLLAGRNKKIKGDAAIAMFSVGALALGYFIINTFSKNSPNIAGDVCASLFGSTRLLTLSATDLWIAAGASALVVALFAVFYNKIFAVTFDPEFMQAAGGKARAYEVLIAVVIAVVVSVSMRLVGSLLTGALIVFPALGAMRLFKNFRAVVISSAVIAGAGAALGFILSLLIDSPVGATIVLTDAAAFGVSALAGFLKGRRKQSKLRIDN